MQKTIIITILTFFLFPCRPTASFAQISIDSTLAGLPVNTIVIHGNDRTKAIVITREMKQKIHQKLNLSLIDEDIKRLNNLHIFNRVIILAEPYMGGVLLRIIVTEMWYVYPYPILYINEKDWKKFSYGAGISHLNYRGMAETLGFSFSLGYNPGFDFIYANPWFANDLKLYTKVTLSLHKSRSKHYQNNVNENQVALNWTIGKRFGFHTLLCFDFGGRRVSYSPAVPFSTLSTNGVDIFPKAGIRFQWDRRDLSEYPHKGWLVAAGIKQNGIPGRNIDYSRWATDLRLYLPVSKTITLALRNAALLSTGTVPTYDRIYLGYNERIRGHLNERIEGECRLVSSASIRFPLLPVRYFSIADYPFLSNLKFGISMGLFADAGVIWNQTEKPELKKTLAGYGVGLHFHLPYVNLIRLELAFDEQRKSQYILSMYTAY